VISPFQIALKPIDIRSLLDDLWARLRSSTVPRNGPGRSSRTGDAPFDRLAGQSRQGL
jgi:hypothetical protein